MKKSLLFKLGASLLAIMLMTACNTANTDEEQPDTEQTETDEETEDSGE